MKISNDNFVEVEIKVDPILKFIPDTKSYLTIFCTKTEKIQIQDHGDYSLIASMKLGENHLPTLIGIIDKKGIRLEDNYKGEALYLERFMYTLNRLMLNVKQGGTNELVISKDSLQENRT